jgi:hypothetical protein
MKGSKIAKNTKGISISNRGATFLIGNFAANQSPNTNTNNVANKSQRSIGIFTVKTMKAISAITLF